MQIYTHEIRSNAAVVIESLVLYDDGIAQRTRIANRVIASHKRIKAANTNATAGRKEKKISSNRTVKSEPPRHSEGTFGPNLLSASAQTWNSICPSIVSQCPQVFDS
ncbi:hypothetical protein HYFRA_00006242 [Hymenoscyphus fraxineus]|uniref:Uncharacterized protein n=1 Tax=Hymenoscyphus fraxineus TaxID=746836 RepID=A0A9N9Q1F0_9HELO|nr:hypothetical protein HYFRA_00006242 [Hymenoscyphus fraxineus]